MQNQSHNDERVIYIYGIPTPNEYHIKEFKWTNITLLDERLSNQLEFKEYIPQEKDRLYFYPACDVPRYKVRNWVESIKGSVTIKLENATAKFASKQTLDSFMSRKVFMKVSRTAVLSWLQINYPQTGSSQKLHEELSNSQDNFVYLERILHWSIISGYYPTQYKNSYNAGYKKTLHELSGGDIEHWYTSECIDPDKEKLLAALLEESNIYSQESLIRLVNSNSAVIDSEMYNTLRDMFKSTNREDHVTAMSIMASSNLESSLHHLLLLLEEFSNPLIINMREKNHVNFKSMLEYIGEDRWWKLDIEKQMSILMDKKVLTYSMLKEFAKGVKEMWAERTNNKYFVIKTIEATEEVKNYFKQISTQKK